MTERKGKLDNETFEHIRNCPLCTHSAGAMHIIENALDSARGTEELISFSEIQNRVISKAAAQTIWEKIMSNIKYQYNSRPKLITGLSLAISVFLVITLVPFSYTRTVGYKVTISGWESENSLSPAILSAAIAAIGYENVEVTADEPAKRLAISSIPTQKEALDISSVIVNLTGQGTEPKVEEVRRKVLGTIYAQIAEKTGIRKGGPVKLSFDKGRLYINDADFPDFFYEFDKPDSLIELKFGEILDKLGIERYRISVSKDADRGDNVRVLNIQLLDKEGSVVEEPTIELLITEDKIGARYGDSDESARKRLIDVYAPGDDTAKVIDRRSIIVDFPGGKRIHGKNLILRVKVKED